MIDFLSDNPLFLLFLVIALGYPFGRLRIGGTRFGVATILFAGLAIGAIDEELRLPEIVYELGLVVFVYTIGLSSSREFVHSLREWGLRITGWTLGLLSLGAMMAALLWRIFDLRATEAAGLFAGALTNTPALAGVLDYLDERYSGPQADKVLAEPVVAYSITYPMAVVGTIAAIAIVQRVWRTDYTREARRARELGFEISGSELVSRTILVTNPNATNYSIEALAQARDWGVIFGRVRHGSELRVATGATVLAPGDLVTVIGEAVHLEPAMSFLGVESDRRLDLDRQELDYRRIFVSNPDIVGRRLRELQLPQRFGAIITRVRRGDLDFLPSGKTTLEPGDRVRVVANRERMDTVTKFFGDSYRTLSEVDVLTFSTGIAIGLGIGAIPIPLPGGIEFELGIAGGPLVVALILGALERTGRLTWTVPYGANLTLRQFGLMLFLAGIGTRAGFSFREMISSGHGLALFAAGAVLTLTVTLGALWTAVHLVKLPAGIATGMLAGLQTQPAVLSYALEQSGDDLPNTGYAMVFPLAMIAKIIIAQVLLAALL